MSVISVFTDETLAAERRYLLTYAVFRLRDTDLANDAVQETLVAAMEGKDKFAGRSTLRTWLVSILRNKIYDLLAVRRNEIPLDAAEADGDDDSTSEGIFDTSGRWGPGAKPQAWGSPESTMERKQFWVVFQQCLKAMPTRLQEVFVLREVMGESIDAICKNVGITQSNCSVMLYRARMRLRPCLQMNWYGAAGKRGDHVDRGALR